MLQIAAILLLVSAATCQFNGSYPLSGPLFDGTTVLNCSDPAWVQGNNGCTSNCCTNAEGILYLAFLDFCVYDLRTNDSEMAVNQHALNVQSDLCRFHGITVVAPQLQLTTNATAILDFLNAKDKQLRQEQAIFFTLQIIGGHIGLPVLLILSFLLRKPRRDLTFHNFCFTWVFSSIVFSIGLYRRGPASILYGTTLPFIHSDRECLVQAALTTGAQMMTDTSMCALIVQLWLDFRASIYGPRGFRQSQWTTAALLAAPYVTLLAFLLPALLRHVHSVLPAAIQGKFYCVLGSDTLFVPMYATRLVILGVALICDVCIIRILYRRWRFFRHYRDKGLRISLSLVLRVLVFYVYRVDAAIAYGIIIGGRVKAMKKGLHVGFSTADFSSLDFVPVWINLLQAATPFVAFLVFGTNKEYLNTLMFWRKTPQFIPTPSIGNTNTEASTEGDTSIPSVLDITRDEKLIDGDVAL